MWSGLKYAADLFENAVRALRTGDKVSDGLRLTDDNVFTSFTRSIRTARVADDVEFPTSFPKKINTVEDYLAWASTGGKTADEAAAITKINKVFTDAGFTFSKTTKLPNVVDAAADAKLASKLKVPTWAKATGALFGGYVLFEVISVIMGETLSKSLGCKMPWNKQMDTCSSSGPSGGPGGGGDENLTDAEKEMLGTAGIVLVVLLVFSSVICASFSSSSMMLMMQQK
jgi:hypothetical protein